MRIVGYVRESPDPADGRVAFAQQEQIRRYAADQGHALVAVCQDTRTPGHALGRSGYRSMLGVIASGGAEAVVVAGVEALSSDQIVQEIMLWDLRSRRVKVLSTDPADLAILGEDDPGPSRRLIRVVLARVAEYSEALRSPTPDPASTAPEPDDVVVHLDAADG